MARKMNDGREKKGENGRRKTNIVIEVEREDND